MLALLRTFLSTIVILILISNIVSYHYITDSTNQYLTICLICISSILFVMLTIVSAYWFNLILPNSILPWSETSQIPYCIEFVHKTILLLGFFLRDTKYERYLLIAACECLIGYKLYLRIRKSRILIPIVFKISTCMDMILLHFLSFLLV